MKGSAYELRRLTRKCISNYIVSIIEKLIYFGHLERQGFVQNVALLCKFPYSKSLDGWIFLTYFLKYAKIC